jgi:Tfp pilus assembly protein PilE
MCAKELDAILYYDYTRRSRIENNKVELIKSASPFEKHFFFEQKKDERPFRTDQRNNYQ